MTDLKFTAKNEGGIEFYVSNDGEESGMSIRGLARCAGIARSTLTGILDSIVAGSITIETLKPFIYKDFVFLEVAGSDHNAKIIPSDLCAAIISYYAFESKSAKNNIAKQTLAKFAAIGIDKWIKQAVGFDEQHQDVMQTLSLIYDELKELKQLAPLAKNYIKVKDGVKVEYPGLDEIFESLEDESQVELLPGLKVTLSDWLLTKKVKLTRGGYCAFGRMVAETYKTMRRDMPSKGNRKKSNGKWSMNVHLYGEKDYPILESALKQFLAAG